MDSHERRRADEIFMAGAQCDLRGLCTRALGAHFGGNALFKNNHSTQASGDTFCQRAGTAECLGADGAAAEEEEEEEVAREDMGGRFKQRGCVRGRVKVRASGGLLSGHGGP